ncbi:glutathione S-transferase, putative [Bodo saltans]|uniref:Glutathione S-transferase, putative n=1 Tax=Bodo saltans TaxID=75058 RepID=A0A0S4IXT4_BODSA|nr:glutathione S-transferase, putative [Bodo saltans]|eukprot:CUG06776.1 glutathione S-transferase, putative [Bodo saltans]
MGFFSKGRLGRKLVGAAGVTAIGGGGFAYVVYQRRLKENKSCPAETFNAAQNQEQLQHAFKNLLAKDTTQRPDIQLYRYTTCPFCGTVKALLDIYHVEHNCVEVEPMFKGEIKAMSYKKVPQLRFNAKGSDDKNGTMLVDSDIIVDTLAPLLGVGDQLKDENIKQWRAWARNQLVRFLVLDINYSLVEAWKAYNYIDSFDTIPWANKVFLKVMGAPVMYMVAQKFTRPKLVRSGDLKEGEDVRVRLHQEVTKYVNEALVDPKTKKSRTFHGGVKPDLADIDAYGVLQSIRGHRVYDEIIGATQIKPWLDAMDKAAGRAPYVVGNASS